MQKVATSVGMAGDIAMMEVGNSNHRRSSRSRGVVVAPSSGRSLGVASVADMSVASTFYGGGVTIEGGPPDETFKDEFGNECTRYVNRTIIINEHMASAAEMRNLNGPDFAAPSKWRSCRIRALVGLFVAATIVLLLVVLLDVGGNKDMSKEDKLAAAMGYDRVDDWDDDDTAFDKITYSALGDD